MTALPVVAHATIALLAKFADLNAWLDGDTFTRHTDVDLGIAVSLGEDRLVVPVIRAAQQLDIPSLAVAIWDLAVRARAGTLRPEEVRDGTFTITNPGQFGTVMATPVISQPEVAILDMEAIVRRPVAAAARRQGVGCDPPDLRARPVLGSPRAGQRVCGAFPRSVAGAPRARGLTRASWRGRRVVGTGEATTRRGVGRCDRRIGRAGGGSVANASQGKRGLPVAIAFGV